ncbi:MAG: DNA polymerase III subunit delta [Gammaproteobacteria bacterium]|nr:DNA polymerase III subunit delta [Gammaproteobacteria bacterium]
MKIQANQLSSHLKKSLAPCYLVTGDEHLLVDEALDAIREAARARGFSMRELHVATTGFDWAQLTASSGTLSLFSERRIIELRLPTGKPGRTGGQAIIELVEQSGPDTLFIVTGPKLDRSGSASKWAKSMDQKGVSLAIWPIGLRELPGWIANRMRSAGLQPERDVVSLIADRVEGNLLAAGQEIEKLRLLLGEGPVSVEDVSDAVANSSRYDVYKLTDAAMAGDAARAVRILGGLRSEGVEPVIVMWALTRELRTLSRLDDTIRQGGDLGSAMQKNGVWRNRQGLVRSCIGRHQHGAFNRMLKATGRADAAAKGQRAGDPWQMACDIVVGMARL